MRATGLGVCVLALLAGLVSRASAQCTTLGTPGNTGSGACFLTPRFPPPAISCSSSPNLGNGGFTVSGSGFVTTGFPMLALGFCDPTPDLIPTLFACPPIDPGPNPICPAGPGGCVAFIDGCPLGFTFPAPGTAWSWSLPIPNDSTLVGGTVCVEAFAASPFNACLQVSHGLSITILP